MAKNYKTGLIITGDASGGIRAIRATDDQLGKLNKSFDRGSQRTRNYRRGVDETSSSLDQLKSVAGPVAAAIAALGAQSFARGMIEEAQQLETNLLRTQQLIETTDRTATRSAEQMHEQARALALSTLQSTEGVMAAQQTLLTFRNITGGTFDQAIEGAVDLSSAMGMDLNSAVLQLGKALEDPVKGLSALSRSGTVFTDAQKDMVEEMVETNRTAEAQAFILGELAAQYGGVAAKEAQGLVGAQDTFGQKVQEAKIELADQLNVVERSTALYNTASNTLQSLTDNMDTVVSVGGGMAALLAGRLAGSLVTVTARMVATTTAAGALRGALALLGGPIGLLIGAGGLLYVFREELGLADTALNDVDKSAAKTDIALNNLGAAVDDSAEAALDANYQELTSQLFNVGRAAAAARVELAELEAEQNNQRTEQSNSRGRRAVGPQGKEQGVIDAVRINNAREALEKYEAQEQKLLAGMDRNEAAREKAAAARAERDKVRAEGIKRASDLLEDNTDSTDDNNESTNNNAKATGVAAEAAKKYSTELETLRKRLVPGYSEAQQFAQGMSTINVALASGEIGMQEYTRLVGLLHQEMQGTGDDAADLADKVGTEADAMATLFERQLQRMDDAGKDMWRNLLEGGEVSMDSLKDIALDTLAEIVHAYTTQKITANLGVNLPGAGGSGGQSMGGAGGMPSLSGITDAIKGGFNGIQLGGHTSASLGAQNAAQFAGNGLSGTALSSAAQVGGAQGATGFMGGSMSNFSGMTGLASAGAGAVGGMAGTSLGESLFDRQASSNIASQLGAAAGTYLGGPIGSAIGGAIGGALDARFGGSNRQYLSVRTADGMSDADRFGGFESDTVERRQSALGAVGFADDGTYSPHKILGEGGLEQVIEQMINTDALIASFAETSEQLDAMRDAAQGFAINATTSEGLMQGLGDRTSAVIGTLDNDFGAFAQTLDGTGDQVLQQALSAREAYNLVTQSSQRLGLEFDATGASAYAAAAGLADAAGGLQSLDQLQSAYYQTFFTEVEQAAHLQDDLTASMQQMGLQLPETRDGFRDLVKAQDRATQAGRENYVQLLQLAGSFAELTGATEDTAEATGDATRAQEEATRAQEEARRAADRAVESAERQLQRSFSAFDRQAFDQQLTLLEATGDGQAALSLQREKELESIDPLLHETQRFIWQLEDEAQVKQDAAKAGQQYAQEIESIQGQLNSTFTGINQWIDQRNATGGTPRQNLDETGEQFAKQLKAAQTGDRNALQSITQYADRALQANEAFNASGSAGQRIKSDIIDAVKALPDAITTEEFLAQEFRDALQNSITSLGETLPDQIGSALAPMFDSIDLNTDGLIDWNEFYGAFKGLASDEQLKSIYNQLDVNGDGQISKLESLNQSSDKTEKNTKTLEDRAKDQLSELGGLVSEMTRTTDQFVTLNSGINSLSDSINALGVAQDKQSQIEQDRIAAEQAEQARLNEQRRESQISELEEEATRLFGKSSDSARSAASVADDSLTDQRESNLRAMIDRFMGRDGMMSHDEFERVQAHISSNDAFNNNDRMFATRLAASERQSTQAIGLLDDADEIRGQAFATGGVFTNSIVDQPTSFSMGVMGEAGPEAIMPLSNIGGSLGVRFDQGSMPNLLGAGDVLDVMRDLLQENRRLNQRLEKIERHTGAAVQVQQAGFNEQINEQKRGNAALGTMASKARLEGARR